jgi:hypothetical protein
VNSGIKTSAQVSEELNKSNESRDGSTKREAMQHTTARIDRRLVIEEDPFLRLQRDDLKGETESKIIAAQDQALQTKNILQQKYYKQTLIANVDCVNNST